MRFALPLLLVPALALAQGGPPAKAPAPGAEASSPGSPEQAEERWERMAKRMRLARALGLAEALDLDETQATKMNEIMGSFDARRKAPLEQIRASVKVLREAARASQGAKDAKAAPADGKAVDQAVAAIFDARSQLLGVDREMFQALAKGLTPEKRARMALFLARFRQRFGMEILEHSEHRGFGGRKAPGAPDRASGSGWDD